MSVTTLPAIATHGSNSDLARQQVGSPRLALILVAPPWAAEECQPIVRRANDRGSAIYTVRTLDHGSSSTATELWETLADIDAAAAAAALEHPEMPLVLIAHCDEASAACVTIYAETHPTRFADVVIARRHSAA